MMQNVTYVLWQNMLGHRSRHRLDSITIPETYSDSWHTLEGSSKLMQGASFRNSPADEI